MNEQIFKVQVPLESNVKNPPALVYNRDRTVNVTVPVNSFIQAVMQGEPKRFIYGYVKGDEVVMTREAEWQEW